jgi:hypothetical protein
MVNTFLVDSNFDKSASMLDRRRLGKQRVEAIQILKANLGMTKGWRNHPAAVMWRGHEFSLGMYGLSVCDRWISYGYKDTCRDQIYELIGTAVKQATGPMVTDPPMFIYDQNFLDSHRSNLLRKDPAFYSQYEWGINDDLPYFWPKP